MSLFVVDLFLPFAIHLWNVEESVRSLACVISVYLKWIPHGNPMTRPDSIIIFVILVKDR